MRNPFKTKDRIDIDLIEEWAAGTFPWGSLHINESGEVIIHTGLQDTQAGYFIRVEK